MLTAIASTRYGRYRRFLRSFTSLSSYVSRPGNAVSRRVNALTEQWGELTKALHENARVYRASTLRGVQSFHDLDAVSKLRFSAFQNRFFKNFEGMYYSRREGILSTGVVG